MLIPVDIVMLCFTLPNMPLHFTQVLPSIILTLSWQRHKEPLLRCLLHDEI